MSEAATSVHTIETSVLSDNWPSYRKLRLSLCQPEYTATEELYTSIDEQEHKNHVSLMQKCRCFAWFARNDTTGKVHVCSNSCRQRWCPICSGGRASYITNSVKEWLLGVKHPRFLTLTLKHTNAPLNHQIDTLYKHFRNLRKDKQFRQYVKGGVWFFQVKLSKQADQWHPHIHCLISGKYMPHEWICRKWLRITKTSNIVDIRAVKSKKEAAEYVARYCARPAQLSKYPLSLREEIFHSMHGRRLCGKWGKHVAILLSPPKFTDSEKYTKLGTWSTILSLKCTSKEARQIIDCWLKKTKLPPGISFEHIDNEIDGIPNLEQIVSDEYWEPYIPGYT